MPREKKKRGRREEKKQKQDVEAMDVEMDEDTDHPPAKSRKATAGEDYIPTIFDEPSQSSFNALPSDSPFYGLLDEEEQEYFKSADDILVANQFPNPHERELFIESVWREANGKELKIACSQSSSRVLERLIGASNNGQLKGLFGKFENHFLNLVQHRFASHCCEALFLQAAPTVSEEANVSKKRKKEKEHSEEEQNSMENLFISALGELEGNTGYLLTERFASHTLRVLLVVLSGGPLDHPALASKKKESRVRIPAGKNEHQAIRPVPESFLEALDKMIRESVSTLDATYLRALATHPVGNPTIQLLLSIELSRFGKSKGKDENFILRKLVPNDSLEEGSVGYSFLKGLLYDPVGSRLLEVIVQSAPGKTFKSIYKSLFKNKLGTQARHDTASFVTIRVLERLGKEELEDAMASILPEVPTLISSVKLALIKTLIDRCGVRGIDPTAIGKTLQQDNSYGSDPEKMMHAMVHLGWCPEEERALEPPELAQKQRYGVQLAQSMLRSSGFLSELILNGLLALDSEKIIAMAKDSNTSRLIQDAATVSNSNVQFRRKFLPRFYGHLCELALDARGSHLVDALRPATNDLFFLKERFARELAEGEAKLRDSFCGKTVWKNWMMDLYKRRRGEWTAMAKDQGQASAANHEESREEVKQPKSAIDQARQRFAVQIMQKTHGRHAMAPMNA